MTEIEKLLSTIKENEQLAEQIGAILCLDFYDKLQTPYMLNYRYIFSIPGRAFCKDGGGGEYLLLEDGSIAYSGQADECGRVAENVQEFLELILNCAYSWYNYTLLYKHNPEFLNEDIVKYELEGREQFLDAFGDVFSNYDEIQKKVAEALHLKISQDIRKDILPLFFKAATKEPKFYWEEQDLRTKSTNLIS
ncbi:hypothetical protein [Paenibacillus sp. NPDC057934]|uniref:hypothetical protein n=1 Tax=Paenibacillus sp. NPDC057934 TaxID=3346282 RepID=UPI0036D8B876